MKEDLQEELIIPDIAEETRQNIIKLVKGNGLRHDEVKLLSSNQEVIELAGSLVLTVNPNTKEDFVAGESNIENSYESKEAAKTAVNEYLSKVSQEPEVQAKILNFFENLPGKGWGAAEKEHKIPDIAEKFSYSRQCPSCGGKGSLNCPICHGDGQQACIECLGKGRVMCAYCKGFRFIVENGTQVKCMECNGFGSLTCTNCRGSQRIPCQQCNGTKESACVPCNKSGKQSVVETVSLSVMPKFIVDLSETDEAYRTILNSIDLNKIAEKGWAVVKPFEQEEERENVKEQPLNSFEKLYNAYLPIMDGEYRLGENKYVARVIGAENSEIEIPFFIDDLIKPGIGALNKFSKGPFAGDALIAKAIKFRMLNSVISELMTHSKAYVLKKIMAEYPIGLSKKYAQASVHYSKLALDKLLDKPKYVGLGIGLALSIGLIASYFFLPVRNQIMPFMSSNQSVMGADICVAILGMIITYFAVRMSAGKALKKYNIGGNGKLPSAGNQGAIGLAVIAIAYFIILQILPVSPEWYTEIIGG